MVRVGIVGATGYGGREILRLLSGHPEAEVVAVASTSAVGERLDAVLPAYRKVYDLTFEAFDAPTLAKECDVVFIGVPGTESMAPVQALRAAGVRVIDIGADFRLKDASAFQQYYKTEHTAFDLVAEAVYGLVPWYREHIKGANLVAAPGCYPVSIVTPLRPLVDAPISKDMPIVVNSVSGVSGAGRTPKENFHLPEMNDDFFPYKVGTHQHIPEIEQELQGRYTVQYTPHVAPMARGILSTIVVRPTKMFDPAPYFECYAPEPFVRVLGEGKIPQVKHVRGTNFCDFGWVRDERTGNLVIVSAIDNLVGGTAGIAIQSMNLMFSLDERTGLSMGGITP